MPDDLQGQPGAEGHTTAVETTLPVASPEAAPANGAAEPTPATPNLPPESAPAVTDWDKVDVGAYQTLRDQFLATDPAQGEPAPAPVTEPATPAPEAPAVVETPAAPAAAPAEEPEGPFGKGYRPRLGGLDKVKQETIQLVRELAEAGQDIDFATAEARVKAKYGLDAAPAQQTAVTEPGKGSADIRADIERIESELEAAGKSADTEKLASLQRELRKADRDLQHAEQSEQAAANAERAAFVQTKNLVRKDYPDFADENSALSKKYLEIFDQLDAEKSGIMMLPAAQQIRTIARMAAAELGIKPAAANAPAVAAAPAAPAQAPTPTLPVNPPVTRPPVMPASGAQRTATPANQSAQLQAEIDSVKTMDDYEKLKNRFLAS